jgi:hypothetical protein
VKACTKYAGVHLQETESYGHTFVCQLDMWTMLLHQSQGMIWHFWLQHDQTGLHKHTWHNEIAGAELPVDGFDLFF